MRVCSRRRQRGRDKNVFVLRALTFGIHFMLSAHRTNLTCPRPLPDLFRPVFLRFLVMVAKVW